MKRNSILSFFLGGFTFLCIGAGVTTSTNVLTIKPVTPKSILSYFGDSDDVQIKITGYCAKGYVVRHLSFGVTSNGVERAYVVMEKY